MATAITPEEMNVFHGIPLSKKIDSMTLYLIGDGKSQYKYNMSEVGEAVFNDRNYSQTVSLIHRCYNFSGRNGGAYRPGCSFEQRYGYRVTRTDVEAFLRQFPNGTFQSDMTFEKFLTARGGAPQTGRQRRPISQAKQVPPDYAPKSSFEGDLEEQRKISLIMLLACVAVLVFLWATGGLFKHWIISLICALAACGAFLMLKELKRR